MSARSGTFELRLERTLAAPPEHVFAAFVEAEKLAEWWGPAGFTSPRVDLDVREGGRYRIAMQPPAGDVFHLRGTFRRMDPPRRLVYTFEWEEPTPDDRETVVALTFQSSEDGTRLVVDHATFATEERFALHQAGWTEALARLERMLAQTQE